MQNITAIILAAGEGKRMKSDIPKVFHSVAGLPLLSYPIELCRQLKIRKIVVVTGRNSAPFRKEVETFSGKNPDWVEQFPPLGTGHAVMTVLKKIKSKEKDFLILCGDMPLLTPQTVHKLIGEQQARNADLALLTARVPEPAEYGRIVRASDGSVSEVVEYRDASPEQKNISEINLATYCISGPFLRESLKHLTQDNAQKEYYLTDLVGLSTRAGKKTIAILSESTAESTGINSQEDRACVEKLILQKKIRGLMSDGVSFVNPETVVIDETVLVERGSAIYGPCFLFGKTKIGKNCIIEPGSVIRNTRIGDTVMIKANSYIEESIIGNEAQIGPFAHLRPGTEIGERVKVGNFVEIKKSRIDKGSKIPHLSYIGDTSVGKNVNVGAGTITCNYDGKNKHRTIIGDKVFVGSDTQFVAPVRIGKGAIIGAGSTITKNVKPFSLALARAPQTEIKNWTKKKITKGS